MEIVELTCPGCGARVDTGQKICSFCHQPIVISSFTSVKDMKSPELGKYTKAYQNALAEHPENGDLQKSIGICFLKLHLYAKALPAFELAMEENMDDSSVFFYAAACLLGGKKPFLQSLPVIRRAEEYLDSAIMLEPLGIYYYFEAYLRFDYYQRKHLKVLPGWQETFEMARDMGLSRTDVQQMYEVLGTEMPAELEV